MPRPMTKHRKGLAGAREASSPAVNGPHNGRCARGSGSESRYYKRSILVRRAHDAVRGSACFGSADVVQHEDLIASPQQIIGHRPCTSVTRAPEWPRPPDDTTAPFATRCTMRTGAGSTGRLPCQASHSSKRVLRERCVGGDAYIFD